MTAKNIFIGGLVLMLVGMGIWIHRIRTENSAPAPGQQKTPQTLEIKPTPSAQNFTIPAVGAKATGPKQSVRKPKLKRRVYGNATRYPQNSAPPLNFNQDLRR